MRTRTFVRDFCLIAGLLLFSLAFFLFNRLGRKAGSWAVVSVNGTEIQRFSLGIEGEFSLNGGSNILKIKDERACLVDADCPDHLCVKQGFVRFTGQCITCLPNRLTVTIEGGDDQVDIVL